MADIVIVTFVFSEKTFYAKDVDIDWKHWPVKGLVFSLGEDQEDEEYMAAKDLKAVIMTTFDSEEDAQEHIDNELKKNGGRKNFAYAVKFIR